MCFFFFTEWGEVSVGGKCQPTHSTPLNFLCVLTGLVGTWGHFHTYLVTCVSIVTELATGSCSSPYTCMCSFMHLLCFVFQHEHIRAQIWEPPSFVATVFLFFIALCMSGCMCVFGIKRFYGAGTYAFVSVLFDDALSYILRSASCAGSWMPPRKKFPPWQHSSVPM